MKDIGFVKNIDNLGRIVIPMDIRRKLNISTGDVLSICCSDNNICLSKYSSLDNYKVFEIIKLFIECFNLNVILCDKEKVLFSNVVGRDTKIDGNFESLVRNGSTINNNYDAYVFGDNKVEGYYNQVPIVTNEGIIGCLVILRSDIVNSFVVCKLIASIIMLFLNIS